MNLGGTHKKEGRILGSILGSRYLGKVPYCMFTTCPYTRQPEFNCLELDLNNKTCKRVHGSRSMFRIVSWQGGLYWVALVRETTKSQIVPDEIRAASGEGSVS